ncbi:MAG: hypothetical protein CM15mP123_09360 [Gammaproteobacteria bacterium]|nr:MAG: hypothetical protein CM15mP123_09360 [Gammaproteobacteria bacterium]
MSQIGMVSLRGQFLEVLEGEISENEDEECEVCGEMECICEKSPIRRRLKIKLADGKAKNSNCLSLNIYDRWKAYWRGRVYKKNI